MKKITKNQKSGLIVLVLVLLVAVSTVDMQSIIGGTDCYKGSSAFVNDNEILVTFEDSGGATGVMGETNKIDYCDAMIITGGSAELCSAWGFGHITGTDRCTTTGNALGALYLKDFTGKAVLSNNNPVANTDMGLSIGQETATLINPHLNDDGSIYFTYIYSAPVKNFAVAYDYSDGEAFAQIWSRISGVYTLSLTEPCTAADEYEYCSGNVVYAQKCIAGTLEVTQKLVCGGSTVCQIGVDGVGICTSDVNGDTGLDVPLWLIGGLFLFIAVMVFAFFRGKMKR